MFIRRTNGRQTRRTNGKDPWQALGQHGLVADNLAWCAAGAATGRFGAGSLRKARILPAGLRPHWRLRQRLPPGG